MRYAWLWLGMILVLGCGRTRGDNVVLASVADTTLFAAAPGNNLGTSDSLAVGGTGHQQAGRGLLRFNVAAVIPPDVVVTAVRLEFVVTRSPAGGAPSKFRLHRMLKPWSEGRGTGNLGSPSLGGEPTWTHREHPTVAWGQPGGEAGADYVAVPSGEVSMVENGRYAFTGDGLVADVRWWLAHPAENFGWLLGCDAESELFTARRVGSRESGPSAPRLVVEFTAVPLPRPVITRWGVVGDRFELRFAGEAGNIYAVESLDPTDSRAAWQARVSEIVKLVPREVVFSEPLTNTVARIYRVADVGDVD